MRIPSNKITDIISFFRKELSHIYGEEELSNIIWLSFNHVLGFSKTDIHLKRDLCVNQSDLLKLNFICKDLRKHKPVQYILGETEFCGMRLKVNENVLIPRPETEELVHHVYSFANKQFSLKEKIKILDIGTGSGCIGIALKKLLPAASVYAVDVSEDALALARENAILNHADVDFFHGDILNPEKQFPALQPQIIVSNPPYISEEEKHIMDERVLNYEPHLALFAKGGDPLIFYKAILKFAQQYQQTHIFFELNASLAEEVKTAATSQNFEAELSKDIYGKDRFLYAYK